MKLIFFTLLISSSFASTDLQKARLCEATKEYVATLEYLREQKELGLNEQAAQKIADHVSSGCTGAFNRFAKVANILSKVGIDSSTAVTHASDFAKGDDERAVAFIEIFQQTFDSDHLDLDALTSLKISLQLSQSLNSSAKVVLEDFRLLVKFCKSDKHLGLSNNVCADLATKVTSLTGKFGQSMAPNYIKLLEFVSDSGKGPQLDKKHALDIADEVIVNGPKAAENFISAYQYAVSKKGLGLSGKDAISFANKMAKRSYKLEVKN